MSIVYKKALLLIGDSVLFYAALWAALSVRRLTPAPLALLQEHVPAFTTVLAIWLTVFYINDFYNLNRQRNSELLNTIIVGLAINLVLAAVFFYGTARLWNIKPQTILIVTTLVYGALLFWWRSLAQKLFAAQALTTSVIIIGFNRIANDLIRHIAKNPQLGYRIHCVIDEEQPQLETIATCHLNNPDAKKIIGETKDATVVISLHYYQNANVVSMLYDQLRPDITITSLPRFYEEVTGKIPVNQIGEAWVLENFMSGSKRLFGIVKRLIDILAALVLAVITAVLFPFIALAIIIENGRPLFFTQKRVGYLGKHFTAIKFRTMRKDAEEKGPEWAKKNDPRITNVGKILRETRLDELPQFINIFLGDMSLIGSRPERPEFVRELVKEIPFYKERLLVKPGLTGWAQVNFPYGASKEDAMEKLQYDLYYLKNRSFGLECAIILKTIRTVISRKGQ